MSRGPGWVQQAIVDVIAANHDGAWTTALLCKHIYRTADTQKKHRVSVIRALMRMELPETWCLWVGHASGREWCLVNPCNAESVMRADWLSEFSAYPVDFEQWKREYPHCVERAREIARDAQRYWDASPIAKIDIEISGVQKQLGMLRAAGGFIPANRDLVEQMARRIADLQEKKNLISRRPSHSPMSLKPHTAGRRPSSPMPSP
jgi:hypothetical protein